MALHPTQEPNQSTRMRCGYEELLTGLSHLGTRMATVKVIWVHLVLTSLLPNTQGILHKDYKRTN